MSTADWIKAGIDAFQTIIAGVIVALVIFWLDERRAKREQRRSDFRLAANWSNTKPRISLRRFDLTDQNLSNYKFVRANLEETTFANSKMWATNFRGANLRLTDFSKTELVGAKFNKAIVIRGDFSGSTIKARNEPDVIYVPDFSETALMAVKFIGARITGAIFKKANLKGTDFSHTIVFDCDFSGADLTNSNWRRVKSVRNCIWKDVKVDNQANFPDYLWKEIQEQNAKPIRKIKNAK